jgi:hypothetical protein
MFTARVAEQRSRNMNQKGNASREWLRTALFPGEEIGVSRMGWHKTGHSGELPADDEPKQLTHRRGRRKVARPERVELPTFWFVGVAAQRINNLRGEVRRGEV